MQGVKSMVVSQTDAIQTRSRPYSTVGGDGGCRVGEV